MVPLGSGCTSCKAVNPLAARFCLACGSRLPTPQPGESSFRSEGLAIERRRVTVVFCDVVDSTVLAASMDAEDYTELIGKVLRCVTEVIEGFGGFVARYLGDGALSYFGYPSAREDDTERAVRAALAVVGAIPSIALRDGRRLAMRIGVASGEVVVGDIAGVRSPRGLDISGELPSLAARLQATAEPDTVLVDGTVYHAVKSLFEFRSLGQRALKGWSAAVPIWQVLRATAVDARFGRDAATRLPALVGRTSEIALLADLWRGACAGRGRTVLLMGEPGIGKSRLVAGLLQDTAGDRHTRLHYACSSLQQGVPLAPCIREIERTAGFQPEDGPEAKRSKLRTALRSIAAQHFQLICDLLGVQGTEQPSATSQLSPQKRRERTIAALVGGLIDASSRRPVLAVFEDAHWSDPSSRELLDAVVRSVGAYPILLVVTARPEYRPAWAEHADAETIELDPLSTVESRELIASIAGKVRLPREAIRDIASRSDGVPLFIEEVTRAVIESGATAGAIPHRPSGNPSVPAAIHSSLLARLDRLGDAREVAEVAAVIGREFSLELLARVTGQPEAALWPALARLTDAGLLLASPAGEHQFRFKHTLIQDAAYGIIVRGRRRAFHARVAQALEAQFPALAAAEPQIVAHHCTEAGFDAKAVEWWLRAGLQSLTRSAASEALAQLARGLAAAKALPPTPEREQWELDLHIACLKALIATQGHAAPSTSETLAAARDLCERLGKPAQYLSILYGQWTHALFRADLRSARRQAEEILHSAEHQQDDTWHLVGRYCLGITSFPLGLFEQVLDHLRRGLATGATPARAAPLASDPVVGMRTYLGRALMCMGHLEEARRESVAAVARARQLGQAFTLAFALWEEVYLVLNTESIEAALPRLEELKQHADEHGIAFFEAVAMLFEGWSRAMLRDVAGGLALMHEAQDLYVGSGNLLYVPSYMRMEAEALCRAGRPEEGLRVLARGERLRDETGARWDEAEFCRTRAELLWACGRPADAEAAFRKAIRQAQDRSLKLFELRAAASLADRLAGMGRTAEAAGHLAPVCTWFDGRGSSSELTKARRMLDAFASLTD